MGRFTCSRARSRKKIVVGGWPEDEVIIAMLEGMGMDAPAGYIYIPARRPPKAIRTRSLGMTKNNTKYEFPVWDQKSIMTIPIRDITAPPNWPQPGTSHNKSTAAANWLKTTWLA